jgi:hypothetical protein
MSRVQGEMQIELTAPAPRISLVDIGAFAAAPEAADFSVLSFFTLATLSVLPILCVEEEGGRRRKEGGRGTGGYAEKNLRSSGGGTRFCATVLL